MKKLIALLFMSVAFCFALIANVQARGTGDTIGTIRSRYAAINKNIRRYKKVNRELSGYSAEGGTMEAYFDGVNIKKLVAHFYGEMGRTDEEYYFWNDQLIFVFRRESHYDRPLSGKVISIKENRFYFDNLHMIRWIDETGKQVPTSNSDYIGKQNDYLENSREFVGLARP